jgi:NADH-quinone oxidoreductase subunit I
MAYFKDIVEGAWSLVVGMGITIRRIVRPVVTVQYPREHVELSPAYRGHIDLRIFPDTGTHKCIACGICERNCPSNVIKVQGVKEQPKGPKVGNYYVIDFSRCSLCGLCVESCPTNTLEYSKQYELVGYSKEDCVIDLMERLKERQSKAAA